MSHSNDNSELIFCRVSVNAKLIYCRVPFFLFYYVETRLETHELQGIYDRIKQIFSFMTFYKL